MLGGVCVWEGSWSLQQPSLCVHSRGASVQLLSLQLLQVGTSTALLVAQGEGRVLWGQEWEEKDRIKDS